MEMDLYNIAYDENGYDEYIYGSAEVVGLMCLRVFCEGNETLYDKLKADARSLGAAFQKVNFLRDLKSDFSERGRVYFPGVDFNNFDILAKEIIEADIQKDFDSAYRGIMGLPEGAKKGVYLAYVYYLKLFSRIKQTAANRIQHERIRVPDRIKFALLAKTLVQSGLNVL
jgi:phytoene/squalene synthetase